MHGRVMSCDAAMANTDVPKARWNERQPLLDPSKPRTPQIACLAAEMFGLLGGPIFGLIGMVRYPILIPDRVLVLGSLASIALWFAVSFLFIRSKYFPNDMPNSARLMMRFGIAICATGWAIGFVDIANGYATPVITRDAAVAYKRASRDSNPDRRNYYFGARLWSSPRDIVEITVPRDLFNRLVVPNTDLERSHPAFYAMPNRGSVQLAVGQGRFGIEWLHGVMHAAFQPGDGAVSQRAE
jgi:hypothetical protein